MRVTIAAELIETTLRHLREAGARNCECVTLWLARRADHALVVQCVYLPIQTAMEDMFHIPPGGMNALHAELRKQRLMVAAQVHSHPAEAFHSRADDRWAIVRHEGALSLVVPYFARRTNASSFLQDTKVYQFSELARWTEVPSAKVTPAWLQIN
jgi:proteasome lid subunit RPN8/RPN11